MSLWPETPSPSQQTQPDPSQLDQAQPLAPGRTAGPPQLDASPPTVSSGILDPVVMGLESAYGPQWQEPYGTTVGRTLTGATPAEAFPPAAAGGNPAMRDALATTFSEGHRGWDHPEMQAVMRGALADGMPPADRALVNGAALNAAVARDPTTVLDIPPDIPRAQLEAWQRLAVKNMPGEVVSNMASMNAEFRRQYVPSPQESPRASWSTQDISRAEGGIVNMDYFAVRVDRMPRGVTPEQFLAEIRGNMDGFTGSSRGTFSAYPDEFGLRNNASRWSNPDSQNGSFVSIRLPGDPGTVAVIDSDRSH